MNRYRFEPLPPLKAPPRTPPVSDLGLAVSALVLAMGSLVIIITIIARVA
jgi:hypothetical protein